MKACRATDLPEPVCPQSEMRHLSQIADYREPGNILAHYHWKFILASEYFLLAINL
jgi:hypothetical protein